MRAGQTWYALSCGGGEGGSALRRDRGLVDRYVGGRDVRFGGNGHIVVEIQEGKKVFVELIMVP
jgi:hypothetical protein